MLANNNDHWPHALRYVPTDVAEREDPLPLFTLTGLIGVVETLRGSEDEDLWLTVDVVILPTSVCSVMAGK